MWLVFVDDTKQKGLRQGMGHLLALGAVAFEERQVAPYAARVRAIYSEHDVPEHSEFDTELKWSCRKDSWFKRAPGSESLTLLREQCLEAAQACEARATAVVFDLGRTSVQDRRAEKLVLEYLYERVSMMIPPGERAVIVFDKPGGSHKDEDAWISNTRRLTSVGTSYVGPESVILPILTAPSHHHPHLQLADLVAGSLTAAVAGVDYGLDLMAAVKPLLHTNAHGGIGGTGLKLFPGELVNLYHWALGEDSYMRGAWGMTLPTGGGDYGQDDGMSMLGNLRSRQRSKRYKGSH